MFKQLRIAILMAGTIALASLYTVPVKAQEKKDTITVVQPALTGAEKDLADTVQAYAAGVADPQFKAVLTDVIVAVKNVPSDSDPKQWYAYLIGVIGALFGAYMFIKAKFFTKKEPERSTGADDI